MLILLMFLHTPVTICELHNRKYEKEWNHYKEIEQQLNITNLMICTDYPELAQEFFNEK